MENQKNYCPYSIVGASTIPSMDPNHCAMIAQRAMQNGNFEEARHFLSMLLVQLPPTVPQRAAPFLLQRAHCFWELGEFGASLQDMTDAIRAGLPRNGENVEVIATLIKTVFDLLCFILEPCFELNPLNTDWVYVTLRC